MGVCSSEMGGKDTSYGSWLLDLAGADSGPAVFVLQCKGKRKIRKIPGEYESEK